MNAERTAWVAPKGAFPSRVSVRADSAPERVVKQILKNLEAGHMQPGEQLPTQEKLAEIFGVGRSSIREATNALSIMGYLKIIQGKGTFISEKLPVDKSSSAAGTFSRIRFSSISRPAVCMTARGSSAVNCSIR